MKTLIILSLLISAQAFAQWQPDVRLTNNAAGSYTTGNNAWCIASSGDSVHVVWFDFRDGNNEIYYKRSPDGGVSWSADTRLTSNSANSYSPSVSVSGSAVHVVWYDGRDGNNEVYYKRDPTGNSIGIKNINSEVPKEFSLSQNFPNPFNPTTKIRFALRKSSIAKLVVYDALGREIETILNEQLNAGTYEVDWEAAKYPSGIYFYELGADNFVETKKMMLIK